MMAPVWIAALLLLGLGLIVLEVFLPSGGVLGLLAVVALGAAIVTAFVEQGIATGLGVLAASFLLVPVVLAVAFRWFPETPLGRRVLPAPPLPDDVLPDAERRRVARSLVGRRGRALIDLLPCGTVEVAGLTCDAVSEGEPIAAAAEVEVTGVQGATLVVRRAAGPAAASAAPPVPRALEEALEGFDFGRFGPPEPPRPSP